MDILSFLSGCPGNSKILGYIYFSLIKVMLHSDDSMLFTILQKVSNTLNY